MKVQSRHALPELLGRDLSVSIGIKECKGPPHVEALQEKGCGYLVQDLVEAALPEVLGLELGAEFLDLNFSSLSWIGNASEESMVLHREGQIELADSLLELADRDDASLGVEGIVEVLEAVIEGDIPLLEECHDLALQGLLSLILSRPKVLRVNSCTSLHLLVSLLPELCKSIAMITFTQVLLYGDGLLPHILDHSLQSLLEVMELDKVISHVNSPGAGLLASVDSPAALDGIEAQQLLVRLAQVGTLGSQQVCEVLSCDY